MKSRQQAPRSISVRGGVLGGLLAGTALLPVDADSGTSVLELLVDVLGASLATGVLLALTIGLPYLFGLLVALHTASRASFGRWAIARAHDLLILEIFAVGVVLAGRGAGIAPWALLGVASSAALARVGDRLSRHGAPTPVAFHVQWGALLIAATFGWIRIQFIGSGVRPGFAIAATCVCAALLAAAPARESSIQAP